MHRAWSTFATKQVLQRSYDCSRRLSSAAVLRSSDHRPLKVGILPFLEEVDDATVKDVLREAGAAVYQQQVSATSTLSSFLTRPFDWGRRGIAESTKLESYRKVYLPYNLVDAIIIVHSTTAIGSARMYSELCDVLEGELINTDPFTDPELQLLNVDAPPATKVKYEALDVERHLKAKGVEWYPFSFSPTTLAASLSRDKFLFKPIPLLALSTKAREEQTDAATKSIKKGEQQVQSKDRLVLYPDVLSVEYLSMSPIMLPFYIANLSNSSASISEDKRKLTLASPGWKMTDGSVHLVNTHFGHGKEALPGQKSSPQQWTSDTVKVRKNIQVFFSPRIPIESGLREEADRVNQATREADEKFEENVQAELRQKGISRTFANMQKVRETYREEDRRQRKDASNRMAVVQEEEKRRDAVEVTFVESNSQQRVQEAIERALSDDLAASQASAYQLRHREAGEEVAPEKRVDLGGSINWNSPHVTAPSGCDGKPDFRNHRSYFEAYAAWRDDVNHINLWERTAYEDSNLMYGTKTGKQVIEDARKKMDSLKPAWVSAWRESLPKEIHKTGAEMMELGKKKSSKVSDGDEEGPTVGDFIKPGKSQRLLQQEAQDRKRKRQEMVDLARKRLDKKLQKEETKKQVSIMQIDLRVLESGHRQLQEQSITQVGGDVYKASVMRARLKQSKETIKRKQAEIKTVQRG